MPVKAEVEERITIIQIARDNGSHTLWCLKEWATDYVYYLETISLFSELQTSRRSVWFWLCLN